MCNNNPLLVVEECVRQLVAGGFTELKEKETWKIQPLGKVRDSQQCDSDDLPIRSTTYMINLQQNR